MKLQFDDGLVVEGTSFGCEKNVAGEVVFNTAMTGYIETLTDPSYRGQILVLTYPLQGNYGVPEGPLESERIQVSGFVVSHYSPHPSHFKQISSLGYWLKSQGIPAMYGGDTRKLTRYLREYGTMHAQLIADVKQPVAHMDIEQVLNHVGPNTTLRYGKSDIKILLIDTGGKENIVRSLVSRGVSVIRVPWASHWETYLPEVDGIFLTNGPGDPMSAQSLVARVRRLLSQDLPIFGICFGNQLLALASGAKTRKMKYGHRSVNQPVKDLRTGRCYITSQNHGYVVDQDTLSKDWQPWFINLNDKTNEGIRHISKPFYSVQFHPEAAPGPNDTRFLFDDFIATATQLKLKKQEVMA